MLKLLKKLEKIRKKSNSIEVKNKTLSKSLFLLLELI